MWWTEMIRKVPHGEAKEIGTIWMSNGDITMYRLMRITEEKDHSIEHWEPIEE